MQANKGILIIGFLVTLLVGIVLGIYLQSSQPNNQPIDLNPIAKNCEYAGKIYKSGEGFPSDDGCNSCSCVDGEVACTLMACE